MTRLRGEIPPVVSAVASTVPVVDTARALVRPDVATGIRTTAGQPLEEQQG
jgi:hypothetical protein